MTSDNKTIANRSNKRPAKGASDNKNNDQSSQTKKRKTVSTPPADEKTLGDYIANEDEWFNDDATDVEKESSKYMKIKFLKKDEDQIKLTQKRLKVDLAHFLKTGETKLIVASTEATASQRVASIEFDINAIKMEYKRDLTAFVDEVKNLFDWLETG
ncbi:unnamed protein product, partial [Cylindrotheca closterium]